MTQGRLDGKRALVSGAQVAIDGGRYQTCAR